MGKFLWTVVVFFKYKQLINGYEVTAWWRPFDEKSETGTVMLNFLNVETGAEYQYWSLKYNSYDTDKISFAKDFKGHQKGDIHYFDYTTPDTKDPFKEVNGNSPLGYYTPFQFLDIDFDGEDELLISDWYQGQAGNGYEVFKLTEKGLQKLDYMPLDRLSNIDRIDTKNRTITLVLFDGASDEAEFYFSHKKRKDKITVKPEFYSSCANRFDFAKYNKELGAPFALDSIAERVAREREGMIRASYRVEGERIVRCIRGGS